MKNGQGEFARGYVTTNSTESVFAFRLNDGNVRRHTLEQLHSLLDPAVGKRLTYKVNQPEIPKGLGTIVDAAFACVPPPEWLIIEARQN